MTAPFFRVIFRTCDVVASVHHTPRPFGLDKKTLIKICFKSLYDSLQGHPHSLFILGDKLSDEMLAFFSAYPVEVSNGVYGNDESIRQSFLKAAAYADEDWVYFCEDDYLHRSETFRFVSNFIQQKQAIIPDARKKFFETADPLLSRANLYFFLADYPDRYWPADREPVYLFHSTDCHWRQVFNVTFSFLTKGGTVKKYKPVFDKSSVGVNDGYLSDKLFRKKAYGRQNLCLSPLPGLTAHMHRETLSPLVNWEAIAAEHVRRLLP